MSKKAEKYTRRRLRSSYISVVVSISLVLFVLGAFGLLIMNAQTIAKQVKENFAMTILIERDASEQELRQFQKEINLMDAVKSSQFISKEDAAEVLKEDLDEDFISFLGYNPLLDAIEVKMNAAYVENNFLSSFQEDLEKREFISELIYDKPLIQLMNDNIQRISYFLVGGALVLSLIAIGLINSSIRLSIYSKRFLIKTMQLVGATKGFIRRPFIWRSFRHGIYGAVIALSLLASLVYYAGQWIPDFQALQQQTILISIGILILLLGVFISMICTFFALRKYLKLKTDQLYF